MKTAMQQLMDLMSEQPFTFGNAINLVILNELIEKEKEQIMNAYCDGAKGGANGTKGQHENGWVSIQMRNKYYNQTYNNGI